MAQRQRKTRSVRFRARSGVGILYGAFRTPFLRPLPQGRGRRGPASRPAAVFSSGDNRWHAFDRWTPREARKLTFYLSDGGRLETRRPTAKSSASAYTSDPADPVPYIESFGERRPKEYMLADQRFVSDRSDVLTFVTEPLDGDMTLAGPVDVELEVILSTTDADFVVRLIVVFPDDDPQSRLPVLVRGDVRLGRFRDGSRAPKPLRRGVPARVPFRMTDIAHTFRAGHRVMIQVQSTWFPLAERSPQQFVDVWNSAALRISCPAKSRCCTSGATLRPLPCGGSEKADPVRRSVPAYAAPRRYARIA